LGRTDVALIRAPECACGGVPDHAHIGKDPQCVTWQPWGSAGGSATRFSAARNPLPLLYDTRANIGPPLGLDCTKYCTHREPIQVRYLIMLTLAERYGVRMVV
jgi:hypothetical protein